MRSASSVPPVIEWCARYCMRPGAAAGLRQGDRVLRVDDQPVLDAQQLRERIRESVAGVRVGHVTVIEGDSIRTGVTAILPHGGNVFQERVPAAIHVARCGTRISSVCPSRRST